MKLKLSTDLRNWNETWDYELSELAPTVTMTLTRGDKIKTVKLSQIEGGKFHDKQIADGIDEDGNPVKIQKGFFKTK